MLYKIISFALFIYSIICIYTFTAMEKGFLVKKIRGFYSGLNHQEQKISSPLFITNDLLTKKPFYYRHALNQTKKSRVYIKNIKEVKSYMESQIWPLVVMISTGKLGNNIHNYAMALVLQKRFPNATFSVSRRVQDYMETAFDSRCLQLAVLDDQFVYGKIHNYSSIVVVQPNLKDGDLGEYVVDAVKSVLNKKSILILESYVIQYFNGYETFLRQKLQLRDDLLVKADQFLKNTLEKVENKKNVTFVGFHIRRQDYSHFAKVYIGLSSLPGLYFYNRSIEYYKRRITNPVFIVSSDDVPYAKRAVADHHNLFIKENGSAVEDFALLASCSHSIMTVGSYGFWSSFFAGGRVVYAHLDHTDRKPYVHFSSDGKGFKNFVGIFPFELSL